MPHVGGSGLNALQGSGRAAELSRLHEAAEARLEGRLRALGRL